MIKSYQLSVSNNSNFVENSVVMKIDLPAGVTIVGYSTEPGESFNKSVPSWIIPSIAGGQVARMVLQLEVPAGFYGTMVTAVSGLKQDANMTNNKSQIVIQTAQDACENKILEGSGCGDPYRQQVVDILDACTCGTLGLKDCKCWGCSSKYRMIPSSGVNVQSVKIDYDTGEYCVQPVSRFLPWEFKFEVLCENCEMPGPGPGRYGPFGPGTVKGFATLTSEDVVGNIEYDDTITGVGTKAEPVGVNVCPASYTKDTCNPKVASNLLKRLTDQCNNVTACLTVECDDVQTCIKNNLSNFVCEAEELLVATECGLTIDIEKMIEAINTNIEDLTLSDVVIGIVGGLVCAGENILVWDVDDNCFHVDETALDAHIATYLVANPLSLGDLDDVNPAGANNGQVLTYQAGQWVPGNTSTFSCASLNTCPISSLQDVSNTAPSSGQVLAWNGSAWAPAAPFSCSSLNTCTLDQLGNVQVPSPMAGEVLKYDGVKWVSAAESGSGFSCAALSLCNASSLQDVNYATAPVNGKILKYNGTHWVPSDESWGTQVVQHDTTLTGDGTLASTLKVNKNTVLPYTVQLPVTVDTVLASGHRYVEVDASGNNVQITLPSSGNVNVGDVVIVKVVDTNSGGFQVTVVAPSGVIIKTTIAAATSTHNTIVVGDAYVYLWNGTNWAII